MPQQHRKSSYGGVAAAMKWLFLYCLGCLENRTVASQRPCGGRPAPLLRPYDEIVITATTVRVSCGRLPVSLSTPHSFWSQESCDRSNICDHYYRSLQGLTIFKNHIYKP